MANATPEQMKEAVARVRGECERVMAKGQVAIMTTPEFLLYLLDRAELCDTLEQAVAIALGKCVEPKDESHT
jgi:hypothetical protein